MGRKEFHLAITKLISLVQGNQDFVNIALSNGEPVSNRDSMETRICKGSRMMQMLARAGINSCTIPNCVSARQLTYNELDVRQQRDLTNVASRVGVKEGRPPKKANSHVTSFISSFGRFLASSKGQLSEIKGLQFVQSPLFEE